MFVFEIEPFLICVHVVGAATNADTHCAYSLGKWLGNTRIYGADMQTLQFAGSYGYCM